MLIAFLFLRRILFCVFVVILLRLFLVFLMVMVPVGLLFGGLTLKLPFGDGIVIPSDIHTIVGSPDFAFPLVFCVHGFLEHLTFHFDGVANR